MALTSTTNPRDLAYTLSQQTDGEVRALDDGVWLDDRAARELIETHTIASYWKGQAAEWEHEARSEYQERYEIELRVEALEKLLGEVLDEKPADGPLSDELIRKITLTIGA